MKISNSGWKVTFEGGFWEKHGAAGEEVSLNKSFIWGDELWTALSAYICDKGLVIDFGVEISLDKLNTFLDKWNMRGLGYEKESRINQEKIENEQPLNICFWSEIICNGNKLQSDTGCSISWIPSSFHLDKYSIDDETRQFMIHYGLDADKAWSLWRCSYRWIGKKERELQVMELSLKREKKKYIGESLGELHNGDFIDVTHPVSGQKYRINIQEITCEEIDPSVFRQPGMEFPTNYRMLRYTMDPEIDNHHFILQDGCEGDNPRPIVNYGPTVVVNTIKRAHSAEKISNAEAKTACSAMHFNKEFEVDWIPSFFVKAMDDLYIEMRIDKKLWGK